MSNVTAKIQVKEAGNGRFIKTNNKDWFLFQNCTYLGAHIPLIPKIFVRFSVAERERGLNKHKSRRNLWLIYLTVKKFSHCKNLFLHRRTSVEQKSGRKNECMFYLMNMPRKTYFFLFLFQTTFSFSIQTFKDWVPL